MSAVTVQAVFEGLANGSVYGLAAIGLTFIYRVTGMLNFSQGVVVTVAGLCYATWTSAGAGVVTAAVAAIVVAAAISTVTGAGLSRWFGPERHMTGALLTLALALAIEGAAAIIFGNNPLTAPPLVSIPNVHAAGAVIQGDQIFIIVCAALASFAFWAWLRGTQQGKVFTALVDDPFGAQILGLRIGRLRIGAFMVGGLLAGIAGVAITPALTMAYNSGDSLLLSALTAAAIGGMGNPLAALVGGVAVGLIESIVSSIVGSLWQDAIPLVILTIVLAVSPEGLLRVRSARSV